MTKENFPELKKHVNLQFERIKGIPGKTDGRKGVYLGKILAL